MSEMPDYPNRIWLYEAYKGCLSLQWTRNKYNGQAEYIRADIADQFAEALKEFSYGESSVDRHFAAIKAESALEAYRKAKGE